MSMYQPETRRKSPLGLLFAVLVVFGMWAYMKYALDKSRVLAVSRISQRPRQAQSEVRSQTAEPGDLAPSEQRTIDIFSRVSPSVVSVANRALVSDFWGMRAFEIPQGTGSGFVWDNRGHLVSNFHVVEGASSITATLSDGKIYEATVVGVDPDHDIAVLKIDAPESSLSPVTTGSSGNLKVGQSVLAIGNPFGLDTSLSVGIVSALGRSIESMTGRPISDVIQTDAAINPGNSGGPLLDSSGRLIGINTAIVSPSGAYAGVGFAVPVDTVKRIVPQLIKNGRVRRVGLGVNVFPDNISARVAKSGVMISYVAPQGPADKAGLRGVNQSSLGLVPGDVIVTIDSSEVKNNEDLITILDRHDAGDEIDLTYIREDKRNTTKVKLQHID